MSPARLNSSPSNADNPVGLHHVAALTRRGIFAVGVLLLAVLTFVPFVDSLWLVVGLLLPAVASRVSAWRQSCPAVTPAAATKRLGPYLLKHKLGSGGMGEVYLAEHTLMKRDCAVKLIHADQAQDEEMQICFEREAKATALLTHWNTIEVYDYGTAPDGRFYYVMEYLQGVNLWQYVKQYGPMYAGRVIYVLKQLCDALYEAECAGLVHRDIKPSNVFLTERGRSFDVAKLLDFGLVQTITDQPVHIRDVSTKLRGSPAFMCPEQAVGKASDCRGDLYSLGAVAYYLLTGRPPFLDDNPIMLVVAHATSEVPTFKDIGIPVPTDLSDVVLKCLSRDPVDRFASARCLREALEECDHASSWSWRDAEEWWIDHAPHTDPAATKPKPLLADTADVHDTAPCEFPVPSVSAQNSPSPIDFEQPTAVMHAAAELQLASS